MREFDASWDLFSYLGISWPYHDTAVEELNRIQQWTRPLYMLYQMSYWGAPFGIYDRK